MYDNLFVHSSVDGHLSCFHILTIENCAEIVEEFLRELKIIQETNNNCRFIFTSGIPHETPYVDKDI